MLLPRNYLRDYPFFLWTLYAREFQSMRGLAFLDFESKLDRKFRQIRISNSRLHLAWLTLISGWSFSAHQTPEVVFWLPQIFVTGSAKLTGSGGAIVAYFPEIEKQTEIIWTAASQCQQEGFSLVKIEAALSATSLGWNPKMEDYLNGFLNCCLEGTKHLNFQRIFKWLVIL